MLEGKVQGFCCFTAKSLHLNNENSPESLGLQGRLRCSVHMIIQEPTPEIKDIWGERKDFQKKDT